MWRGSLAHCARARAYAFVRRPVGGAGAGGSVTSKGSGACSSGAGGGVMSKGSGACSSGAGAYSSGARWFSACASDWARARRGR